jgi:hypothetical protein
MRGYTAHVRLYLGEVLLAELTTAHVQVRSPRSSAAAPAQRCGLKDRTEARRRNGERPAGQGAQICVPGSMGILTRARRPGGVP